MLMQDANHSANVFFDSSQMFLNRQTNSAADRHQIRLNEQSRKLDDPIDPRIQIELENLNTSTDLINKLEVDLDDARAHFRQLLSESSQKIDNLAKKLGCCVERARPYYEARIRSKELQMETQKAALRFKRATSSHLAAKEMVRLAEEGLQRDGKIFDPAWQEMINHSTSRVNEAELERVASEKEHERASKDYNDSEKLVIQLHQQLKKSIVKARPYFEMKAQFNQMLDEQISKIRTLEDRVSKAKLSYAKALQSLEEISDEIHEKRKTNSACLGTRGVGVGEESPPSSSSSPKLIKAIRKLSLESIPFYQMNKIPWLYRRSKSEASEETSTPSSEKDECESVADSIDTLDDNAIDNLMLDKTLELEFHDIIESSGNR